MQPQSELHSVSDLLQQLEGDQSDAARQLWDRFIHRLIGVARKRLQNLPRRAVDEEDVAISAFDAFFRGVKNLVWPSRSSCSDPRISWCSMSRRTTSI